MKFAHIGDCHLGGWRQPELKALNFLYFQEAVQKIIKEKVDFLLIAGDLFDSAYPPIETLKETFQEFRKIREAQIPVFIIAGSHDYSVSGKTFLDVLEKAGFCKNVALFEEKNGKLYLHPTVYKNVAVYGYPGKKSGLEVDEIARICLHDSPGLFKILMLHTALRDAVGSLPIKAVEYRNLPSVDYLALSHLHIRYQKEGRAYSGPIFPNNLSELEELKGGSFFIFDQGKLRREELKLKEVLSLHLELRDAFHAAEEIIRLFEQHLLKDKIIMLKMFGVLEKGKISDIDFQLVEEYVKKKGAYVFLRSTSKLHVHEPEIKVDYLDASNLEAQIIGKFQESNPGKYNPLISELMRVLQAEKMEDEKTAAFEERIMGEIRRVLVL
jgi:DNA repair exonuclease SbcCD nuclease subunit